MKRSVLLPLAKEKKSRCFQKKREKSLSESPETTMEIEGEDGTKLFLKAGVKTEFGRGSGFNTEDLTVSRRHLSLEFKPDSVSVEVLGRNPVWVRSGEKIRTFRKSETGEIVAGDRFCVSGNLPIWFTLKRRDEVMEERASPLDGESELNVSDIDPVKEFGFLVIGKEFDQYPKSRMCDVKQWEWFLEDSSNRNSDDEDGDGDKKGRKGLSKKRRRKKGNKDDDDWSVESEEDKELMVKSKRVMSPTYSTRSKKTKIDTNATSSSSSSGAQTKQRGNGRVDVEEDDDDETLGGFIVSDEEAKLEEEDESNVDEEEEEEVDDFDEDEDEE